MEQNYCYPVVIEYDDDGISLFFPDLEEAYSCATNTSEAFKNAKEVLKLTLKGRIKDGEDIPEPTELKNLNLTENQFTSLVEVDVETKIQYDKKTLTIPHELNVAATNAGINFSQVLQKALLIELEKV